MYLLFHLGLNASVPSAQQHLHSKLSFWIFRCLSWMGLKLQWEFGNSGVVVGHWLWPWQQVLTIMCGTDACRLAWMVSFENQFYCKESPTSFEEPCCMQTNCKLPNIQVMNLNEIIRQHHFVSQLSPTKFLA